MADKVGKVLVIGGGIGGMEASLNLVEAGFKVYVVDEKPNIGGTMAQLDKTFPTNDCSMCIMAPKLVEVGRNPNIELLMGTEVVRLEGEPGNFQVVLKRRPRRILKEKCTSCGLCAPHCPLEVPADYNEDMSRRSAAYINFPQAIPSTYSIDREIPPCVNRCPINLNARDYVGLIAQGRFLESLDVIREKLPFPGVIGRICNHPCESACLRGEKVDQPLAICALKRFVADYEVGKREIPVPEVAPAKGKKVAIIGGGPSGMACAIEVRKAGCDVTIYESHEKLGGMLYWGIPAYRLPKNVLERETSVIEKMGVEVRYNTQVGKDISLKDIHGRFDAVYIGIGAQGGRKLGIPNEDTAGVLSGVEFLRAVAKKQPISLGGRVMVVGGGNVAADVALTAKRVGGKEVSLACLEKREEMPASTEEVAQMREEGILIHNSWGPQAVHAVDGKVKGIVFKRCTSVFDDEGRFNPAFNEGITKEFTVDTIILAIGQSTEPDFLADLEGLEVLRGGWIKADPVSLETTVKGVFAGGDAVTGPRLAIDAVAQGREAAESILRYLEGRDLKEGRAAKETELVVEVPENIEKRFRAIIPTVPLSERSGFDEVERALDEMAAMAEAERCLNCRRCLGCRICEDACKPGAINYFQGPEEVKVSVGSVIIATGFEEYDPSVRPELGYGLYRNVVTSTEFERILSATGPTSSIVMRPSDGKIPKKVAWLQCVGSRDKTHGYCSSVCCMYATKEAIIAKEHQNDLEPTIFYMDMRTFGKGFDQYYERAKEEHGVRYIKSAISRVLEDNATGDLDLVYVDEDGEVCTERFDMVVLSVGMRPSPSLGGLARALGVELNEHGFVKTSSVNPLITTREGIFAAGAAESPKDIPETVMQATGAACEAGSVIAGVRGKDFVIQELPDERNVDGEEPRIGVFVCNCGINIGGVVNVPEVRAYAEKLPNVVLADDNLFTCSQDTQDKMKRAIDEHRINRVVVASCSPRTHEPLFRATIREVGLNKYLFEMANIRDQCSWVHMQDKAGATEKAKDLVRMAVTNANFIMPLKDQPIDVNKKALIIGGGMAGMTAALKFADQNFYVYLIEKEAELGGNLRHIYRTLDGLDVQAFLKETIEKVTSHPLIEVETGAVIVDHSGFKGNFKTTIATGPEATRKTMEHGALVVASGATEFKPFGRYSYGEDDRVMTQTELEAKIAEGTLPRFSRCLMVQCVGSREEERPYCSRICCSVAVKNAITLKTNDPACDVVVLYRDIRTYGFLEQYYSRARNLGVRFIRFEPQKAPVLDRANGSLRMSCFDQSVGETVELDTDIVVLSAAVVAAPGNRAIADLLKVPLTNEGFFFEAHMKLRPVDFASDGMFLCGLAHSPKNLKESMTQAEGAVARAITILSKDRMAVGGVVSRVDGEKCASCLTCVRACPYSVPFINEKGEAEIDISKCKGCGICCAECPAKAIDLMHYKDAQIIAKAQTLFAHSGGQ
ncbi:MAG: Glutamate synthase (NADPH) small chain [Syntrophorhabdaceae bacterium PtaU1.Bin034]|nr:MAG: Glutamate synthase (NADPH) small chain [Syntrophorhabdaceae bacterium PtaU1.Bin034]